MSATYLPKSHAIRLTLTWPGMGLTFLLPAAMTIAAIERFVGELEAFYGA